MKTDKEIAEEYFLGANKYVKCTVDVTIWQKPGGLSVRTVKATDTIGRVVAINATGTWGKLDDDTWIFLNNKMFTVILTVPPPKSITQAVVRETQNALQYLGLEKYAKILIGLIVIFLGWQMFWPLFKSFFRSRH